MPGNISQYQVVIAGQIIAASLWNGMENNIINNGLIPSGIDDYSATDSEMQTQTDPFPGGTISRATSLQGELERLRFEIAELKGETYHYNDPDITLAASATFNSTHRHTGTTDGLKIPTAGIEDGAITTAKLGALSLTDSQINDVAATKITGQITTSQITNAAVNTAKLASSLAIDTLDINTNIKHKTFQAYPILQILYYDTATATSTSSTTYVTTNLSGAITPKLNTSKILVFVSGNLSMTGSGIAYLSLFRGSTDLALTNGGYALNGSQNNQASIITYDSPATTSSTTYSARIRHNSGTGTVTFPGTDGGLYTPTATLILVEVAQ